MIPRPITYRRCILFLCMIMLVACQASPEIALRPYDPGRIATPGTRPDASAVAVTTTTATPTSSPTVTPVPPTPTPVPTRWTIGLLDEPGILMPFSPDGRAAAPLIEAMFPAPVLALDNVYTTTGVLDGMPTYDNGGLERQTVEGFLDASGQFTTTETAQPTTVEQLVVTFRWNRALRWADGEPVTAYDSVFAYEEARRLPATPEMAGILDLLQSYEALDEYTTRGVLKPAQIDPTYPIVAWTPLPRHILENAAPAVRDRYSYEPLGYGPYTFGESGDGLIVLKRNPYWIQQDIPDHLRFRFFSTATDLVAAAREGNIDVAVLERIRAEEYAMLEADDMRVVWRNGPVYEQALFNLGDAVLQDVRVRQAVALAINRQGIVDDLVGGKARVLHSWIMPAQHPYAGDEQLTRYPYNPERARQLLDAAGFVDANGDGAREAPDGSVFTLTLLTTDTEPRIGIAQRIAADLQAVGLTTTARAMATADLYAPTGPLYRREFQLALFGWLEGVEPNGTPLWSCAAIPGPDNAFTGNNFAGWCFEEAEQALDAASGTLNARERAAAYLRHQHLWSRELPAVPLFQRPIATLFAPDIEGIAPDALAPITWNVDAWRR